MAHIEEKPYEFLVRYEPDGTVRGAHFITREVRTEDGAEPEWLERQNVQTVSLGNYEGLPLAGVIEGVHAAAMARVGTLEQQLAEAQTQIADLERELAARPAETA